MPSPEFNEWTLHRGESQGRMPVSDAASGHFAFALTDQFQNPIDLDLTGPLPYVVVYQSVDVTTLTAIALHMRYKSSPDSDWRIQVSIGGIDVYERIVPAGSPDKGWHIVIVPCGKIAGVRTLAVIAGIAP